MAKTRSRFLALMRGINVGGRNVIAKDDLRRCFEDLGFTSVRTYIQSGNVLFRSGESSVKGLTTTIEQGLSERFAYLAQAVVLSHRKYKSAVGAAPDGWGTNDKQKHNALFTLAGITPRKVLAQLPPPKAELEIVTPGSGVIFWSISKQQQSQTTLMKLAADPLYQRMTVRNHNTVFELLELFEDM